MSLDLPLLRRLFFWLAYVRNQAPWDTNQTPPELIEVIEGARRLPAGAALDIGCGTGTNVVYLAQHGWRALGVDFVRGAIDQAWDKARRAGVDAQFFVGDVLDLASLPLGDPFDLAVDIGCLHSLPVAGRERYLAGLNAVLKPGGTYLLYTFAPHRVRWYMTGISPADVEALFGSTFAIERVEHGVGRRGTPSAWFTMRRR